MVLPDHCFLNGNKLQYQQSMKNYQPRNQTKNNKSKNKAELEEKIINEELKIVHKKFAAVSNNKASGNIDLVCQRHCAHVLSMNLI